MQCEAQQVYLPLKLEYCGQNLEVNCTACGGVTAEKRCRHFRVLDLNFQSSTCSRATEELSRNSVVCSSEFLAQVTHRQTNARIKPQTESQMYTSRGPQKALLVRRS